MIDTIFPVNPWTPVFYSKVEKINRVSCVTYHGPKWNWLIKFSVPSCLFTKHQWHKVIKVWLEWASSWLQLQWISNLHSIASCGLFHRPTMPLFPFSLIWYSKTFIYIYIFYILSGLIIFIILKSPICYNPYVFDRFSS